jgi:hypothetical protein
VPATPSASWPIPPRIVAEALRELEDPLATLLEPPPPAPAAAVARGIVAALSAGEKTLPPPGWLLPSQHRSFRRILAALEGFGGGLLADPVGAGKTYVALAVASVLAPGRTVAIVPAALLDQWRRTSLKLGVTIQLHSHERCSRGQLPGADRTLVVIDECHRFRHPATRRYRHLAPWLIGRSVLLVSATPVVNRVEDLAAQLLLGIRDDALRASGVPSLRAMLTAGRGHPALGEVIVAATAGGYAPVRRERRIQTGEIPRPIIEAIDRLAHSARPPVAALLRGVAWQAAASSPAALLGVLGRYRALLLQAQDAAREGRRLPRSALREFSGGLEEQLVLWAMVEQPLEQELAECDLPLEDIDRIAALVPEVRLWARSGDAKCEALAAHLADGRPSLVFTTARETVRYLRNLLPPPVAWCTGDGAGLGPARVERGTVLAWFGPAHRWPGPGTPPRILLSTDVTAEGLDLQSAGRVVHYDLPWTPVRLVQREGRALRLGSGHAAVEVLRFDPPPEIEQRLRKSWYLARKAGLPSLVGLGDGGRPMWRWRDAVAAELGEGAAVEGAAAVKAGGRGPGLLAGFRLVEATARERWRAAGEVVWLPEDGVPSSDPGIIEALLIDVLTAAPAEPPCAGPQAAALARLAAFISQRLAEARRDRWRLGRATPEARALIRRLHRLLIHARRRRDQVALAAIEKGLAFAARGHTAGETMLAGQLVLASERALIERLALLPRDREEWFPLLPQLTGLIAFRS